jgi:hypothetical protein
MARESQAGSKALDQALQDFLNSQPPAATAARLPANRVLKQEVKPEAPEAEAGAPSLRSAYDQVLEQDAAKKALKPEAPPSLWQRFRAPALLILMCAGAGYVWFGKPAWLRDPVHVGLSAPRTATTARRQLVAIALEVEDFRRTTGRLPTTLTDLGLAVSHVHYVALADGRFELSLGSGPHTTRYRGAAAGASVSDSVETQ